MKRIKITAIIIIILFLLVGIRLMLPSFAKDYVNKVIANIPGYSGSIGDVDIHLWRGAYTLHRIEINKNEGTIPVPFLEIPVMDLAIEWRALFHGSVVAVVHLDNPIINFAISADRKTSQTGKEADWARPLDELLPIEVNIFTISNGKISYQDFSAEPKINISITDIALEARNLRNVEDKYVELPSEFALTGNSAGGGKLTITGYANILKDPLDIDLDGKLENVNLPALNNYARHYAKVDFSKGTLNLYAELAVKDGQLSGYLKPLAKDIVFIELSAQDKNPIDVAWEAIVAAFTKIFTNQSKDQMATKVPLEGDLSDPESSMWLTLAGIIKNAFVQAFGNTIDNTVTFPESP